MLKSSKGITLVALVITIIVLLILAGVTLSIVFNDGLIEKSQNAVDKYSNAQDYENDLLTNFMNRVDIIWDKYNLDGKTTTTPAASVNQ